MASQTDPAELLTTNLLAHPRLILPGREANAFELVRQKIEADPTASQWYESIKQHADQILAKPVSEREIPDGRRLLQVSRKVLRRVKSLGLVANLTGERAYVERAMAEMDAAAAFSDWNPSHFLDVGEMTAALAIGLDWLHGELGEDQRRRITAAIVHHGLELGLKAHDNVNGMWWSRSKYNWNQVCNGGMMMGALAIAESEPELAGRILEAGRDSLSVAMGTFAPSGAWAEGPMYWGYTMLYTSMLLSSLERSLGEDLGISQVAGFEHTGSFPVQMSGPTSKPFNFGDARLERPCNPAFMWLAQRFDQPALAEFERQAVSALGDKNDGRSTPNPLDVIWYDPRRAAEGTKGRKHEGTKGGEEGGTEAVNQPPRHAHFAGAEVASMRSAWNDANALFAGINAGDNQVSHGQLDLGSFVFEGLGVRWAVDLGADGYNLPGYFDKHEGRWWYYRNRAEGHNTLVINPDHKPDQDLHAYARFTRFEPTDTTCTASIDLTPAYANQGAKAVQRTALFDDRQGLTVIDHVRLGQGGRIWWFMHTEARIELADDARSALLSQDGRQCRVTLATPREAGFTVREAGPLPESPSPDGQNANEGVTKLAIELTGTTETTITVRLEPVPSPS